MHRYRGRAHLTGWVSMFNMRTQSFTQIAGYDVFLKKKKMCLTLGFHHHLPSLPYSVSCGCCILMCWQCLDVHYLSQNGTLTCIFFSAAYATAAV